MQLRPWNICNSCFQSPLCLKNFLRINLQCLRVLYKLNQFLPALHLHSLCAFPTNVTILSNHKSAADDKHILHFLFAITFTFFLFSIHPSTHLLGQIFRQRALPLQKKIFEWREIWSFEQIFGQYKEILDQHTCVF